MAIRNIVKIDEEKCNGCGKCVNACAEGAIQLINGKAKLVRDDYCDGLGDCLGSCPQDAITIEQREAQCFDETAVEKHLANQKQKTQQTNQTAAKEKLPCGCPSTFAKTIERDVAQDNPVKQNSQNEKCLTEPNPSQLSNWPVQLMLLSPNAAYLQQSDLLFAADCVAFAVGDFHKRFLNGKTLAVACPKLDETDIYIEKLKDIIANNDLNSITVVHMEVPCCSGMTRLVEKAIRQLNSNMTFEDITVSLKGEIINVQTLPVT